MPAYHAFHVPPQGFPSDMAREVVEKELGATIDEIFSEFAAEPTAAASLAQVYLSISSCIYSFIYLYPSISIYLSLSIYLSI